MLSKDDKLSISPEEDNDELEEKHPHPEGWFKKPNVNRENENQNQNQKKIVYEIKVNNRDKFNPLAALKSNCCFNCSGIFLFISITLVGVAGFFIFNFFDKQADLHLPESYIYKISGEVEIKKQGTYVFKKAKKNLKLTKGDTIKTGPKSSATLIFYEDSQAEIDENSEVLIKDLFIDKDDYANKKINLKVSVGKVWSRVLQLLDKEAQYEVESSNTVATVRGTIFDFIVHKNNLVEISSLESEVEVNTYRNPNDKSTKIKGEYLTDMTEVKIDQNSINNPQNLYKIDFIPEEKLNSERYLENTKIDQQFKEDLIEKKQTQVKEIAGILPDSKFYEIELAKEKLQLQLADSKEERTKLIIFSIRKRLAEIQQLIMKGEFSIAKEVLQNLDDYLTQLKLSDDSIALNANLDPIKNQLELQLQALMNLTEKNEAYELKQLLLTFEEKHLIKTPEELNELKLKKLDQALNEERILEKQGQGNLCEKLDQLKKELKLYANPNDEKLLAKIEFTRKKIEIIKQVYCLGELPKSKNDQPKKQTKSNSLKDLFSNEESNEEPLEKKESLLDEDIIKNLTADIQAGYEEKTKKTEDFIEKSQNKIIEYIQKHPFKTIIYTLISGLILGFLYSKRRKNRSNSNPN